MAGYYSVWKSISCLLSISTLIHIGVAGTTPSSVIDNYGACGGVWGQQLEVRAQPGQEQFIESPDFPFYYPNYANCKWRISTNLTGYVIKLETVFVQLENRYDVLRVFDGNSPLSPILLQISTRSVARNLTTYSSGPSVYVTFTTDARTSYQGFRLRFMAVLNSASDLSLACNSPFMPPALDAYPNVVQNIRSMNYPSNYSNNANCYWLIEADYGYVIQLDVREMDLEIVDSCNFDYLEFFDGNGIYSPILTKLCNSSLQYVYSTGQIMYLHFRSDESVVGKGFFLQYTAVPGTNMPSTTTTSSVNATMNTSGVADTTPSSVIDNYGACGGWWGQQLKVRAQPGQEKFIESPGFPFDYPNSADCKWRISTDLTGYIIKLETVFIELENRYDVFQVFDGNSTLSPTLLQISTRSVSRNLTTYSSGPSVYVTFTTDVSTSYQGFRLRFMAVLNTSDSSLACNPSFMPVTLAAYPNVVQNIRSMRYPSNYSNNANCNWLIEADYGYVIQLDVREMDLEIGDSCKFDYLEFFDGRTNYFPMLTKLCNSSLQYVYSTGQRMFLHFRSDESVVGKGFFLQYTAVLETDVPSTTTTSSIRTTMNTSASSNACNSWSRPLYLYIYPWETNTIESPNYPNNYPNRADCGWIISTYTSDYVVELSTDYVDLENNYDVIKVYDGSWISDSGLLRSISSVQSTPVQSTGQWMYVTFTSDGSTTKTGFSLSYTAVLRNGPSFTTTSSPSYHTAYERSSSLWLILGVVLGAIGIIALIISIIVVVKCRRRPRVPTARLCIPPAHMAGGYNNVFAQPGTQTMQLGNGIYVVPAPDPSMPTAIYASAPPAYDNIAFTACFNESSRDVPQQPLENPMCSLHPETGDVPPEYSKIQHSDAACVA